MNEVFRRPSRLFSLVLVGVTLLTIAAGPVDAAPRRKVQGIDVSHWQGPIFWQQVASAGKKFAILKATEGTSFLDPKFASYRANARAAGIVTGAYHYARPDATPNDAVTEAQWMVNNISPIAPDDLLPALDLETAGALSPAALERWTLDWLNEVYRLTGKKPLVFTYNSFWKQKVGNSEAIARAGYGLWISYGGGGGSPNVPANNWGGLGWAIWKYDSCGSVNGIDGCVDLDRTNGDLAQYMFGR